MEHSLMSVIFSERMPRIRQRCVLKRCPEGELTSAENRDLGRSFHQIPKDQLLRQKWEAALGVPDLYLGARVCSLHFQPDDYRDIIKRVLKNTAIPSLFTDAEWDQIYVDSMKHAQWEKALGLYHVILDTLPS